MARRSRKIKRSRPRKVRRVSQKRKSRSRRVSQKRKSRSRRVSRKMKGGSLDAAALHGLRHPTAEETALQYKRDTAHAAEKLANPPKPVATPRARRPLSPGGVRAGADREQRVREERLKQTDKRLKQADKRLAMATGMLSPGSSMAGWQDNDVLLKIKDMLPIAEEERQRKEQEAEKVAKQEAEKVVKQEEKLRLDKRNKEEEITRADLISNISAICRNEIPKVMVEHIVDTYIKKDLTKQDLTKQYLTKQDFYKKLNKWIDPVTGFAIHHTDLKNIGNNLFMVHGYKRKYTIID